MPHRLSAILVTAFVTHVAVAAEPTPYEKYESLIGEELNGSGFVIRHAGKLFGVASIHQFDGKVPKHLEPLEGAPVLLDATKRIRQKDVQALEVKAPAATLQFLRYDAAFTLREGDEVIVIGPSDDKVPGKLTAKGISGEYKSSQGPKELELKTDKPFLAEGGSGGPVLLKKTGAVIGVMLSADSPKLARIVGFETLCLPSEPKPTVK